MTTYLAVATVAPTLVGDAADVVGRRLIYLLILACYGGVNVAIVEVGTYGGLLGLRVVQGLAISGK